MVSENYFRLGRLPDDVIVYLRNAITTMHNPEKAFEWIQFPPVLQDFWWSMFDNTEFEVQWNPVKKWRVQKAFWTAPEHGHRIHKDGLRCKSALNIAVACNKWDWVRFYADEWVAACANTSTGGLTRNVDIEDYESVPPIEQYRQQPGDVYVINVDTFHSFKCNGPEPRIIVQTKFEGWPDFQTLKRSLQERSFNNIIKDHVLQNTLEWNPHPA